MNCTGSPSWSADALRRPDPEALRWHNEHLIGGNSAMRDNDLDMSMRMAAFEHLRRLGEIHDHLTANELKPGFVFKGEPIPLINPRRGIFKPHQMRFLLSIKTVFPKPGGKVWYDDQREVHRGYSALDVDDFSARYSQDEIVRFPAFTSASFSQAGAFGGNVLFIIRALSARAIWWLSPNFHEEEALFPTDCSFRVVDKEFQSAGDERIRVVIVLQETTKRP